METSVFNDPAVVPDNDCLSQVLRGEKDLWEAIKGYLRDTFGSCDEEWKFYGPKSGWVLKVLLGKRNLFFFTPLAGYFRIAFVFGDRAVAAAEKSDLPGNVKGELRNAQKFAEGRGIRVEVKSRQDVENVKKLIAIKVAH